MRFIFDPVMIRLFVILPAITILISTNNYFLFVAFDS